MKKQKNWIIFKNFLCMVTIIMMMLELLFNKMPFIETIIANAAQTPVAEDSILYKETDLFDYDRWDWKIGRAHV